MKVSLNTQFLTGPYGGGMQFAHYLKNYLKSQGVEVVNHLYDQNIDIILHINPFPFHTRETSAYSFFEAYAYKLKHPETIIIERVNECDERKGTRFMNKLLVKASQYSDCIIFIASWLKPLMVKNGLNSQKPSNVILNGANTKIFNTQDKKFWNGKDKLKIVTHHWGSNVHKGHKIYQKLDDLLANKEFSNRYEFTYIGKLPEQVTYSHTRVLSPLAGAALAEELKSHHIYITASENEPAGMHHIEGALCGLPILYINSGALPEYCEGYGLEFDEQTLTQQLEKLREQYSYFEERLSHYNNTAEKMAQEYYNLFTKLYAQRKDFLPRFYPLPLLRTYATFFAFRFKLFRKLKLI